MTRKEAGKLALALLLGAALALPAGVVIGRLGGGGGEAERPARAAGAAGRDLFSPSVLSDPAFLERQREGVEALERHCARTGQDCSVARAARRRLDRLRDGT